MKKQNLERATYFLAIILSAVVLAFMACSRFFDLDTKLVYQGF